MGRSFPFDETKRKRLKSGAIGEPVFLAGYDFIITATYTRRLFLFRETLDPEKIERDLQALLRSYPTFTGTLKKIDGALAIDCDDRGALFVLRESRASLPTDFLEQGSVLAKELALMQHPVAILYNRGPLLMVSLTQMQGGGSVLGVSVCHLLADGGSMTNFLQDWTDLAAGREIRPRIYDRRVLSGLASRYDASRPGEACRYEEMSFLRFAAVGLSMSRVGERARKRFFTYRPEELQQFKQIALNAADDEIRVSRFDVLLVHLWREIARGRGGEHSCDASFLLDLRLRDELPEITRNFVGNAFISREIPATPARLAERSLAEWARSYRQASLYLDREAVGRDFAYLAARHRAGAWWLMPGFAATAHEGGVIINNRMRMREYDMDFGFGRPDGYVGMIAFPRHLIVMPSPEVEGGCVVQLQAPDREITDVRRLPPEVRAT